MERDGLFIFHSVHKVMKAERALKEAGLDIRLMPVPRQLSAECGLSILFYLKDRDEAQIVLEAAGCPYVELYALEGEKYRKLE